MLFSWPCVLVGLTRKWFEVKIFTSNHFRTHAQRERERSHPDHATNPEPRAFRLRTLRLRRSTSTLNRTLWLRQQQLQIAPNRILQLHWRTQSPDHTFDFTEITPQDRTETAPIALRSQLRNGWVLMNLTEFDEFFLVGFCFCVYLLRNGIIYLFESWENVRNKKKMCFLY